MPQAALHCTTHCIVPHCTDPTLADCPAMSFVLSVDKKKSNVELGDQLIQHCTAPHCIVQHCITHCTTLHLSNTRAESACGGSLFWWGSFVFPSKMWRYKQNLQVKAKQDENKYKNRIDLCNCPKMSVRQFKDP